MVAIVLVTGLTAGLWWRSGIEVARKALVATALADIAGGPILIIGLILVAPLFPSGHRWVCQDWFGCIVCFFAFLPGPMLIAELVMFFAKMDMPWKRLFKRLALILAALFVPWLFIVAIATLYGSMG